jgi:hypothetical protein
MTVGNLGKFMRDIVNNLTATVIAPNVLNINVNDFDNFSSANKVVELILNGFDKLFPADEIESDPLPVEPEPEDSQEEETPFVIPLSPSTEEEKSKSSIKSLASTLSVKNLKSISRRNKKPDEPEVSSTSKRCSFGRD